MRLDGVHHVTAVTADAAGNVDFYARVLGLRLVKKTVNFDAPEMYHLYYGDETGSPGSILTFFEIPGAPLGRAGAGMVHRVLLRVASAEAVAFWERRLSDHEVALERSGEALRFRDPEGLGFEIAPDREGGAPRRAAAEDVPPELALSGVAGVRAYEGGRGREATARALEALGFTATADGWETSGPARRARYALDPAPGERPDPGAGTVHHVAFAAPDDEHGRWRERARGAGGFVTDVIDRQYFRSIYFREPGGVLFEVASEGPGFAVDEPPQALGEALRLPPQYERMRPALEERLRPLRNPRSRTTA